MEKGNGGGRGGRLYEEQDFLLNAKRPVWLSGSMTVWEGGGRNCMINKIIFCFQISKL